MDEEEEARGSLDSSMMESWISSSKTCCCWIMRACWMAVSRASGLEADGLCSWIGKGEMGVGAMAVEGDEVLVVVVVVVVVGFFKMPLGFLGCDEVVEVVGVAEDILFRSFGMISLFW